MLVPCTTFAARRHIMLYYIILYYIKIMVSPCTTSAARGEGGGERDRERDRGGEERGRREGERLCGAGPTPGRLYIIVFICYFIWQEAERR